MDTNDSVQADEKITLLRLEDRRDAIIVLLEAAWERFVDEELAGDEAA